MEAMSVVVWSVILICFVVVLPSLLIALILSKIFKFSDKILEKIILIVVIVNSITVGLVLVVHHLQTSVD